MSPITLWITTGDATEQINFASLSVTSLKTYLCWQYALRTLQECLYGFFLPVHKWPPAASVHFSSFYQFENALCCYNDAYRYMCAWYHFPYFHYEWVYAVLIKCLETGQIHSVRLVVRLTYLGLRCVYIHVQFKKCNVFNNHCSNDALSVLLIV